MNGLGMYFELASVAADPSPERLKGVSPDYGQFHIPDALTLLDKAVVALQRAVVYSPAVRAKLEAAAAGVAARRFADANGRLPESLESLVPDYLGAVPIDPFTGRALVFRPVDGGLLVYSVGWNFTDDSGFPNMITPPEGKDRANWKGDYDDTGFRLWEKPPAAPAPAAH